MWLIRYLIKKIYFSYMITLGQRGFLSKHLCLNKEISHEFDFSDVFDQLKDINERDYKYLLALLFKNDIFARTRLIEKLKELKIKTK